MAEGSTKPPDDPAQAGALRLCPGAQPRRCPRRAMEDQRHAADRLCQADPLAARSNRCGRGAPVGMAAVKSVKSVIFYLYIFSGRGHPSRHSQKSGDAGSPTSPTSPPGSGAAAAARHRSAMAAPAMNTCPAPFTEAPMMHKELPACRGNSRPRAKPGGGSKVGAYSQQPAYAGLRLARQFKY